MTTKHRARLLLAAVVSLGLAPVVRGSTYIWTSGSSQFSNPNAWSGGVAPPSDPATVLQFGALNQNYTASNNIVGGFSLNGLVFMPPTGNPFVTHSVDGTRLRFVPNGDQLPFVALPAGSFYSMVGGIDAPIVLSHATHINNQHQSAVIRIDGQISGTG